MKLHHLGIQVIEEDVENFYVDILDFKISRTFSLTNEKSIDTFDINESPAIIYGSCGDVEIELFISKSNLEKSFSHLCLQTENVENIVEKVKQKVYKIYVHKANETYFISDSNNNIFEIKKNYKN